MQQDSHVLTVSHELFTHAPSAFKPRQRAHAHELGSRSGHEVVHEGRGSSPQSGVAMSRHAVVVVVTTSTQGAC